jgi:ABC-type polysaccharide/polyol phosphate transport system ATPase subunit
VSDDPIALPVTPAASTIASTEARPAAPTTTGPVPAAAASPVDSTGAPSRAPGAADDEVPSVDEAAREARAAGLATDMPFGTTVIEARDLGVRYSLRLTRKNTVRQTFTNAFKRRDGPKAFWALRDVSFRLVSGESLAIIGPNGAGKSTLLQVLAGIIVPSAGAISVRGRISSLLTLGAGFDGELSGRENILLAGAFMGMSDEELRDRVERIVQFADIGEFIDAAIKTYSSGMRARLGFAIATSVDPDVLLLDEVLATGDQVFRAKSRARVGELVKQAKGIVLVTHDMTWVTEYCNRAILLEKGRIVVEGEPADVVAVHQEHSAQAKARQAEEIARYGGAVTRR